MKKVLFTATVDSHILAFHIPFLKYFKSRGYEVHVATNGDEKIPYCDKKYKVPFERNPFSIANITALIQLKKILRKEKYEIIHTHTPVGAAITRIAAKKSRTKDHTRVIYTAHGLHFYKGAPLLNWILFYPVEKKLSKYTDTLILINKEDYEFCKKKFTACKDIQYVNGVGIDKDKFNKKLSKAKIEQKRQELGISKDDFVAIFVARLDKNKNQKMLIDCVEALALEKKFIHLLLVGPDEMNGYYDKIIKEKKLEKYIHLLGYRDDIQDLMKISNISLSSSKREGLPVNIIEAFACGLPVIAYNCRGSKDLIENEVNGYVVNNKIEMVKAIKEIMINHEKSAAISKRNILKAKKYYQDNILKLMEKIYKKRKKVLHLLSSNSFSGAENVACTIINNLKEKCDLVYCCPKGEVTEILKLKKITYVPIKKITIKELKKVIKNVQPDIIHAHDNKATVIASFFGEEYTVISHIHGNNEIMRTSNPKTLLFNYCTKRLRKIIWVSDSSLNYYYYKKNVIKKSLVLYNVIDAVEIRKKANEYKFKKQYDLIYLGRLAYPKNPQRLISLVKTIQKTHKNISVGIIGDGVDKESIKKMINEYKLEKNIELLGYQQNPYPILNSAKILIMTSIYEGTPMCALEALALGKPVIATPVDGLKRLIKNDINGYLSNDDKVLCEKIIEIIKNDKIRKKMSKAALKEFNSNNDLEKYCKVIMEIYGVE